ncbi:glutamate-5-semialdehyde dehydrogenase [Loigolactobacillus backii]|uniref:Gamma-glutamyl phosphate reductase n=1 Tax=Loigolactobacillus backii TaxID=375175 RepID=A0A192H4L0_9LACO|nr:glutamate-5-semialdehyde dehydrogenase [Loigolactobacillus backii]ANK59781.1 gamma-glutamyl-phosphate reductase [Loigolactobacillus backii]ANK63183.1 gamma-glutamyl-phosphate reductase [Loigolactobacillus backii]ANK64777.1 gamma-glutamyl-phosphate reductase [Loigolactobacillus backii]ANK66775.1 gamma-glutamyl-phosphate reductase [Loigolactobacillus backii]ANK69811.1 gamma-glutamyl-phosphate reductase [Loigolactobacillus backii]
MNLNKMGVAAKQAAFTLGQLATSRKDQVLNAMADALLANQTQLLQANAQDLVTAKVRQVKPPMLDRLKLDEDRIQAMATGLRQVANLPDPIGNIDGGFTNEAGLVISKQRVPLGVIGMIYEARPNVTVDAAALCFKSGNAVILRGGKEAIQSNQALTKILQDVLKVQALPEAAIQLVSDTSHETARALMQLNDYLDVLIPRGSGSFIKTVVQTATVPVIETGAGNCHIYVDESADLAMAVRIIVNAKTQRPSVCNAMEKLIINEKVAKSFLPAIAKALAPYQVELRGDTAARKILPLITPATEADWETEYNDYILAIKVVPDLASAINHINRYNTQHSEAIITNNYQHSVQFTQQIDAAVVYVNASTRFTDGFEFGFGAEIGISTQKLHARGPMGLRELTTTKYVVLGTGQIRE